MMEYVGPGAELDFYPFITLHRRALSLSSLLRFTGDDGGKLGQLICQGHAGLRPQVVRGDIAANPRKWRRNAQVLPMSAHGTTIRAIIHL